MIETVGGPEAGYDRVEVQLAAEGAQLTEREHTVLRLRFEDDLNQREIGRRLGVSQMQVSRIMRTALRKVLEAVQGDELPDGPSFPLEQSGSGCGSTRSFAAQSRSRAPPVRTIPSRAFADAEVEKALEAAGLRE